MLLPFNVYQIRGRSDELGIKVALLLFLLLHVIQSPFKQIERALNDYEEDYSPSSFKEG